MTPDDIRRAGLAAVRRELETNATASTWFLPVTEVQIVDAREERRKELLNKVREALRDSNDLGFTPDLESLVLDVFEFLLSHPS